jgi:hypothetical protein
MLVAVLSNCGCLEEVGKASISDYDDNALFCGEDRWFSTILDFEVTIKAYDSYSGTPKHPEEKPNNKATKQIYSKYDISVVPIDPNEGKGDSSRYQDPDANGDGIPDGYQATDDIAWGVDGILQSIPQSANGVGYEGKLYNGISQNYIEYTSDIRPQSEKRAGVRASESGKGIISDIFLGTMDRPFMSMDYNYQDNFLDEVVYIAVPIIVHVTAKGPLGREIYSTEVTTPLFIHLPKPGQDQTVTDYVYLEVFTPLKWMGGGFVTLKAEGTEVSGYGWINIKSDSTILSQIYQNWKKQMEETADMYEKIAVAFLIGGVVVALIALVVSMMLMWAELGDYGNVGEGDYLFLPGTEWKFDKGIINGVREWGYKILPGLAETGGEASET